MEPSSPPRAASWLLGAVLVLAAWAAVMACSLPQENAEHLLRGSTMGTTYTVKVVEEEASRERLAELAEGIEGRLEEVDGKMSTYLPESELSRFNASEGIDPFPLSPQTLEVMAVALEVSRRTAGAFDVTVGPLVRAWGFGPDGPARTAPSQELLEELGQRVGADPLILGEGSVTKAREGVSCDLSAIAKGYAVDRVVEFLEQSGVESYMVEVGGEVRTRGRNGEERGWRIGIERPVEDRRSLHRVVELGQLAMASSGNYRNFYDLEGQRVSHTIDPRTRRPVSHGAAAVTVIHESCLWADAWATALMVLGPEEGIEVARRENLAALFLVYDEAETFREVPSPAFERWLQDGAGVGG